MLQQAIIWGVGTRDPSGCRVTLVPGVLPDFFYSDLQFVILGILMEEDVAAYVKYEWTASSTCSI